MGVKWAELMKSLVGGKAATESDVSIDINRAEANEALASLEQVGCVEVSAEVAKELGAFHEQAITIDDVIDDVG